MTSCFLSETSVSVREEKKKRKTAMDNSGSITYSSSFHRITEAGKDPDKIDSNL